MKVNEENREKFVIIAYDFRINGTPGISPTPWLQQTFSIFP